MFSPYLGHHHQHQLAEPSSQHQTLPAHHQHQQHKICVIFRKIFVLYFSVIVWVRPGGHLQSRLAQAEVPLGTFRWGMACPVQCGVRHNNNNYVLYCIFFAFSCNHVAHKKNMCVCVGVGPTIFLSSKQRRECDNCGVCPSLWQLELDTSPHPTSSLHKCICLYFYIFVRTMYSTWMYFWAWHIAFPPPTSSHTSHSKM